MKQHIIILLIVVSRVLVGCNTNQIQLYDFSNIRESDNSIIITPSSNIFFSQNNGDNYQIISYDILSGKFSTPKQVRSNNRLPFFFNNKMCYLTEVKKNEGNYKINDKQLCAILGNKPVDKIVTSKNGNTLLIKFQNNDSLFILSVLDTQIRFIKVLNEDLNAADISDDYNTAVISSGKKLLCINLSDSSMFEIGKNWDCQKLNPFIDKDKVYFASYGSANNYQLYSASILNASELPVLEFQSNGYDLRLPKKIGARFFFIEIQSSNYLLKYFDTTTKQITTVNTNGVVYSYECYNNQIFFVYSDLITPRGLKSCDLNTKKITDLTCKNVQLNIVMNMISKEVKEPPAYIFSKLQKEAPKAIILYFHPGRVGYDFSPRWDNMILPFCLNGYTVLCPNFPMSTGYGRLYESQSFDSSVNYMAKWVDYIYTKYPSRRIYLYGSSSGSVLMEACLLRASDKIAGAISSFGLSYSGYLPDKIPLFFVLGKKDPIVPYKQRKRMLKQMNSKENVTIMSLNEGHSIQHPKNFVYYYEEIFSFLAKNKVVN